MIDILLERLVRDNLRKITLTDKMTSFLVKNKKRGTYQAVEESKKLETEITNSVIQYINEWLKNELVDGSIKDILEKEIKSQVTLELYSKGFVKIMN